jgi:hypothetical protein
MVMASLEKSPNSLQTDGWHGASFHASLLPESGHADLVEMVFGLADLFTGDTTCAHG